MMKSISARRTAKKLAGTIRLYQRLFNKSPNIGSAEFSRWLANDPYIQLTITRLQSEGSGRGAPIALDNGATLVTLGVNFSSANQADIEPLSFH